jgi:hypothetical protein
LVSAAPVLMAGNLERMQKGKISRFGCYIKREFQTAAVKGTFGRAAAPTLSPGQRRSAD